MTASKFPNPERSSFSWLNYGKELAVCRSAPFLCSLYPLPGCLSRERFSFARHRRCGEKNKNGAMMAPKRRTCFCCCIQNLKKHCPNGQVFEICLTSYNVYFKNCAKSCKTPKRTLAISKNSSIIKARNPTGLQRIFLERGGTYV